MVLVNVYATVENKVEILESIVVFVIDSLINLLNLIVVVKENVLNAVMNIKKVQVLEDDYAIMKMVIVN